MKTLVTLAILGVTGLAGAAGAEANDGSRHRGPEPRHERRMPYRNHGNDRDVRHERSERVWIAPCYEARIVGYECGRPITRQICVSAGHWTLRLCD
ncbi:MAG TPA: hypothetical protein VE981_11080 [Planctomycetota bacterium]|nr:hypothetical protein [Planctomycetota bacterium]